MAVGMIQWICARSDIGHDCGNERPNFLNFFLSPSGDQIPGDDLRGEKRSPRDTDFSLGAGPFAMIESLHDQVDDQPVRRNPPLPGGLFDAVPLFRRDPDVLLDGLRHRFLLPLLFIAGCLSAPNTTSVTAHGFRFEANF